MEVPLFSGSRCPGVGGGLASRTGLQCEQPLQAQPFPTELHITVQSSSGPTWCLGKPWWSPALGWWQEIEDSCDELFKFILVDYVACIFDVLDIRLGEETSDLRVVFGAAGQGNMPQEVWSEVRPGVPSLPCQRGIPALTMSPFLPGEAGAAPAFPLAFQHRCHRLLEAQSSLQDLQHLRGFLPPSAAPQEHRGSNH